MPRNKKRNHTFEKGFIKKRNGGRQNKRDKKGKMYVKALRITSNSNRNYSFAHVLISRVITGENRAILNLSKLSKTFRSVLNLLVESNNNLCLQFILIEI